MTNTRLSPRVVSVVGARPQFVKLAPIHLEFAKRGISHQIVHSGQHYDERLSQQFFRDLQIPAPVLNLESGSGSHAGQTARIIEKLDSALDLLRPDVVLLYGDTNTTLAGAVVTSKRGEYLVHVEAGLRSFNREMPEEVNRIATDHLSDLLLAPTRTALDLLGREGLAQRSHLVGDVMVDALRHTEERIRLHPPQMPDGWKEQTPYVFATLHRAENTDNSSRLKYLFDRLGGLHSDVRLAAHPRLIARIQEFGIAASGGLTLWEPFSYPQTISSIVNAVAVVTDSGGLQKEAALLSVPCVTARHETEWTETVDADWNIVDPHLNTDLSGWVSRVRDPVGIDVFGDGHASARVVSTILAEYGRCRARN